MDYAGIAHVVVNIIVIMYILSLHVNVIMTLKLRWAGILDKYHYSFWIMHYRYIIANHGTTSNTN